MHRDEVLNLPRGTDVIPARKARGMGGGGTTVNNFNFNGGVIMQDEAIEFVNKARLAWERAGNA